MSSSSKTINVNNLQKTGGDVEAGVQDEPPPPMIRIDTGMIPWIIRWTSGAPERIITLLVALATHFGVVKEVAAELISTVKGHCKGPWDDIAGTLRQGPCFDINGICA